MARVQAPRSVTSAAAALRLTSPAIAAIVATIASPALADVLTNSMNARIRVDTSCRLLTESLHFGNTNIFSGQVDATTSIRLRCGPAVAYSVAIDNGQNANGAQRRLWNGGGWFQYVNYQIYRDAARTQVWGATTGNMVTGVTPANGQVNLVAYGRVPPAIVMPNEYTDVVTVTVNF